MRMCGFIATVINLQYTGHQSVNVKMSSPREREAAEYIKKHEIVDLMDNLTSMLFFYRPDRPRTFLIDQLEKLKISKEHQGNTPCLLNVSNLDALFGILDPSNEGCITYGQYKEVLKTIGIKNFSAFPDGASENKISQETFIREVTNGL